MSRIMPKTLFLSLLLISNKNTLPTNNQQTHKKAIIIGASTGMGRALAKKLASEGYIIGLAARNYEKLQTLQQEISTPTHIQKMDVSDYKNSATQLNQLISTLGGLDLLVLTASGWTSSSAAPRSWEYERTLLHTDTLGLTALMRAGLTFFEKQKQGHLVGFSSIDGLRGIAACPVYSAVKAYCSRYLEAERNYFAQNNIPVTVTEIIPGWINSSGEPAKNTNPQAYWVETLENATQEIFDAIKNKVSVAYICKRWEKVAQLLPLIPDDLYNALNARPGGGL